MKMIHFLLALIMCSVAPSVASDSTPDPQAQLEKVFRAGKSYTLEGMTLYVEKIVNGKLVFSPPLPATASLGAFITPVDAAASSFQEAAGRSPRKLIDGSGWSETWRGSGVYIHVANAAEMWNGAGNAPAAWLNFDLGKIYNVSGMYVWNYNETGSWSARSVHEMDVLSSIDGKTFTPMGSYTLEQAPGIDDYRGQTISFKTVVHARYIKFDIKSNFMGNDVSGLAEVRFANADEKAPAPGVVVWNPKYSHPQHPKLTLGQPLAGAENIVYPSDAGILDVTKAPYNAKGDGVTDDTAAIQKALNQYVAGGEIVYLPNGVYLISDTLKWPTGKDDSGKFTSLQGQSRNGTIVKLKDSCPGFDNPHRPKSPIYTGYAPAQRFGNEICNLTVDTGVDNPGACGIQFIANNQGGVYDVTIVSGDGQGLIGLDMAYTDEEGPLLIKNVKVVGFDTGIQTSHALASETMEHITLENQNVCGFRNDGEPVSLRDLHSLNDVPAVQNNGGLLTLIDCVLTGQGKASALPAIQNGAGLLARNIKTTGYARALENHAGNSTKVEGNDILEFRSQDLIRLLNTSQVTLGLPIKETPDLLWDDPKTWAMPQQYGAKTDDGQDDSDAIQKAIDSGASTVFLPRGGYHIGKTIILHGKLRRLMGGKAYLMVAEPLKSQNQPLFRLEDSSGVDSQPPDVAVERMFTDFSNGPFCFIEHASKRTLLLRQLAINFQGAAAYRNTGTGPVFIEDIVGGAFTFKNQQVWARQFNSERQETGSHVINDAGTLWTLGFKTEGGGTQLETKTGGKTEILGGLIGDTSSGKLAPMFVSTDSQLSVTISEVCFNNDPFDKWISETIAGQTKLFGNKDPLSGLRLIFFEGHK